MMGFVARLVLAYGGIFTALGVQLPFLPLWLGAKGLDDRLIGVVLGVASLARLVSIPMTTAAADRFGDLRRTIAGCAAAIAISYTALAASNNHAAVFALVVAGAAASAGLLPLIEGYALIGLGRLRRPYGPVRMWGSGFFVVGNLGAGLLVAVMPATDLIWILVALYWLEFVFVFALRPLRMPLKERKSRGAFRALLRVPGVPGVLLAASLMQSSHAVYYAFSAIHWSQAGLSGGTIGLLWSIGVVAEIVLFWLSPRLPAMFAPATLLPSPHRL